MRYSSPSDYWPSPKSYSVGQFTDLRLYYDAISIGLKRGVINTEILANFLPERVIGLKYVKGFKARTFQDLIRELTNYGMLIKKGSFYKITPEGVKLKDLFESNPSEYYNTLTRKMNDLYVIPGWFIDRLWKLNNDGQGQIVIPSPIKEWKPKTRDVSNYRWSDELNNVTLDTLSVIQKKLPHSLPVDINMLNFEIMTEYERQGSNSNALRKGGENTTHTTKTKFSPRKRLTLSMQNATVNLLFGNWNPITNTKDFNMKKDPVKPRAFMVWCHRLEALGLIFYTDYNYEIPGRIIFPTSIFRTDTSDRRFNILNYIKNPDRKSLAIFSPQWEDFKHEFLKTIHEVYQTFYNKDGVIYVSLHDLRDEVCRLLRINASIFEEFIKKAFDESIKRNIDFAISLETDIRTHQTNQMLRRGVSIDRVQHSLIAIKPFNN